MNNSEEVHNASSNKYRQFSADSYHDFTDIFNFYLSNSSDVPSIRKEKEIATCSTYGQRDTTNW